MKYFLYVCCFLASHLNFAQSGSPSSYDWGFNAEVNTVQQYGNTVYVGGGFTIVGKKQPYGVPKNASTYSVSSGYDVPNGIVKVVLADGSGGWYLGGAFTQLGTTTRNYVAHVNASGVVDSWNAGIAIKSGGYVKSLRIKGDTLFIGGNFSSVNSTTRNNIAAVLRSTGALTDWNPNINSVVNAIAIYGDTVYAGGGFTTVAGSTTRNKLASFNANTAAVTAWNPNANSNVTALEVSGNALYAGGSFSTISSVTRNKAAAYDLTVQTPTITTWNPNVGSGLNTGTIATIATDGTNIFLGGHFDAMNGATVTRYNMAAVNKTDGSIVSGFNIPADQDVSYLTVANNKLYVGGVFSTLNNQNRSGYGVIQLSDNTLTNELFNQNQEVAAIGATANHLYIGGSFTLTDCITRNRLMSFNATSGEPTSWNPNMNSSVAALHVYNTTLYVGGDFTSAGGNTRRRLASYDLTNGNLNSWNPSITATVPSGISARVTSIAANSSAVYVGGEFNLVNSAACNNLVAIELGSSGRISAFNPNPNTSVNTLLLTNTSIYVGGWFTTIGGATRNYAACLDLTTGAANSWNPSPNSGVFSLAYDYNNIYLGGNFTALGATTRNYLASVHPTTAALGSFNPNLNRFCQTLAIDATTLYVGGNFSTVGGGLTTRNYMAAFTTSTGAVTDFNPNCDNSVYGLNLSGSKLYAGGVFNTVGGSGFVSLAGFSVPSSPFTNNWSASTGNWNVASNWSLGTVPDGSGNVTISSGTPTLNVDYTQAAGTTMTLSGTASLVIGASKTLTIAGTVDFGGKSVTLKSTSSGTASIGQVTGLLSNATNVTVERYLPATGRAYRLLSSGGVSTSGSLKDNWMEGGLNTAMGSNVNPVSGYGTQVTGTGGNANGFDITGGNAPSIYTSNNGTSNSLSYSALGNTSVALNPLTGYYVFVRGDRSQNMMLINTNVAPNPIPLPTSATTLRATGTLVQGTQTSFTNALQSSNGAMNLITNPYACAIDFSQVYASSSNIQDSYTFWDPNNGYRGGFVTVSGGVATSGSATNVIQPGQAFYVTATGGGAVAVSIQESHKVATGAGTAVFGAQVPSTLVSIGLYYKDGTGKRRLTDGVKLRYGAGYQKGLDAQDAYEIANWDENLALVREGKHLAIESRPVIILDDTLPLLTANLKAMSYELQVDGQGFTQPWLEGWVIDRYTGVRTPLNVNGSTLVSFTVGSSPGSSASDRFRVEYSTAGAPPLQMRNLKVVLKNGAGWLSWESASEYRVLGYEVEKSANGVDYLKAGGLSAKTALNAYNFYDWSDGAVAGGTSYYRIRALLMDGTVQYSAPVQLVLGKSGSRVQAYPNPLRGGGFTLQLDRLPAGRYTLEWSNAQGQLLGREQWNHEGGFNLYHPAVPSQKGVMNWKLTQGAQVWKGQLTSL